MAKEEELNYFENRYPFEGKIKVNPKKIEEIQNNYIKISKKNLEQMKKFPNRAKSMSYFENSLLDKTERIKELKEFKKKGGKVVGVFCIHVPEELVYAAGAVPIRLSCGLYDSIAPAEEILPKNTCPLIKSSIGFNFLKINPLFELCDVVIIPTSCDGKKKMADLLSNYVKVWTFELPNGKDSESSKRFWIEQVKDLKEKLEKLTSNKISKSKLKEKILLLHKRTAVSRELFDLRKDQEPLISGRDAYLVMQVAFFDDISRWMKNLEQLIQELKSNKNQLKYKPLPRIVVTGSPLIWPNMKLLHIIEETGAIVVADDSCACGQYFYNPVELDEWSMKAMLEGITDKYLLPVVCPIFVHADDRIDRILQLVKDYNADGVVYHILRLCQVFDFEYTKVSKTLEKKGIPLIKIETEYSEEDLGQIKTRIEAFIEMMEARK
jgi:benzoyl-CoA reductase/2-hydroxyglutaryl-CoA dehydratase subunit BcrC/BadD/HgdB